MSGIFPNGISEVIRFPTSLANAIPRIFQNDTDEDRAAIQPLINQVVAYPLSDFTGEMKTIEWKAAQDIPTPDEGGGGETRWVVPDKYFDQFPDVLAMVPPLPGEEAMYAQFRWLMDVVTKDPKLKTAIVDEAGKAEKEIIGPFLQWKHNGTPAGNGWNRSTNNAQWGIDYYDRTGPARSRRPPATRSAVRGRKRWGCCL